MRLDLFNEMAIIGVAPLRCVVAGKQLGSGKGFMRMACHILRPSLVETARRAEGVAGSSAGTSAQATGGGKIAARFIDLPFAHRCFPFFSFLNH
jgi:hypothetical protein